MPCGSFYALTATGRLITIEFAGLRNSDVATF